MPPFPTFRGGGGGAQSRAAAKTGGGRARDNRDEEDAAQRRSELDEKSRSCSDRERGTTFRRGGCGGEGADAAREGSADGGARSQLSARRGGGVDTGRHQRRGGSSSSGGSLEGSSSWTRSGGDASASESQSASEGTDASDVASEPASDSESSEAEDEAEEDGCDGRGGTRGLAARLWSNGGTALMAARRIFTTPDSDDSDADAHEEGGAERRTLGVDTTSGREGHNQNRAKDATGAKGGSSRESSHGLSSPLAGRYGGKFGHAAATPSSTSESEYDSAVEKGEETKEEEEEEEDEEWKEGYKRGYTTRRRSVEGEEEDDLEAGVRRVMSKRSCGDSRHRKPELTSAPPTRGTGAARARAHARAHSGKMSSRLAAMTAARRRVAHTVSLGEQAERGRSGLELGATVAAIESKYFTDAAAATVSKGRSSSLASSLSAEATAGNPERAPLLHSLHSLGSLRFLDPASSTDESGSWSWLSMIPASESASNEKRRITLSSTPAMTSSVMRFVTLFALALSGVAMLAVGSHIVFSKGLPVTRGPEWYAATASTRYLTNGTHIAGGGDGDGGSGDTGDGGGDGTTVGEPPLRRRADDLSSVVVLDAVTGAQQQKRLVTMDLAGTGVSSMTTSLPLAATAAAEDSKPSPSMGENVEGASASSSESLSLDHLEEAATESMQRDTTDADADSATAATAGANEVASTSSPDDDEVSRQPHITPDMPYEAQQEEYARFARDEAERNDRIAAHVAEQVADAEERDAAARAVAEEVTHHDDVTALAMPRMEPGREEEEPRGEEQAPAAAAITSAVVVDVDIDTDIANRVDQSVYAFETAVEPGEELVVEVPDDLTEEARVRRERVAGNRRR